jgi:gamma-glutamylcyclotransferase (GGCT)/AIG2-like uncharacterized protein YtfP
MSTPEQFEREQRSSVAVSMTAKGEATVTVKVYDTDDLEGLPGRLDTLRAEAVRTYSETVKAVRT